MGKKQTLRGNPINLEALRTRLRKLNHSGITISRSMNHGPAITTPVAKNHVVVTEFDVVTMDCTINTNASSGWDGLVNQLKAGFKAQAQTKTTEQKTYKNCAGIKKILVARSVNPQAFAKQTAQDRKWADAGYTRLEAMVISAVRDEQNRLAWELKQAKGVARKYWAEQLKRSGGSQMYDWLMYKAARKVPMTATRVDGVAA